MSDVVPKQYLNKYGGVFTSEIRDVRTKKRKRQRKSEEHTIPLLDNNIGNARPTKNPNISSEIKQNETYTKLFSTYKPPIKRSK